MLEVVAWFAAAILVLLICIAKFCHEVVVELRSLQELLWSKIDKPIDQPTQEQVEEFNRIIHHIEVELAKQRSRFWNGH